MKCRGFLLLPLLFLLSVETGAQDNRFGKTGQRFGGLEDMATIQAPCPDYKMIIITPPKDVDFKMRVNTPSKNMDPGIVSKICKEEHPLAFAPQFVMPDGFSTGNDFMTGHGDIIISGKGNVFTLPRIK
jgi:hypothetical protein